MTALRITAGTLRGRRIDVPKTDLRPTSERARQAFFNIVAPQLDGASFLDLFAGTGIFSFEAISRGASEAQAVDVARASILSIERNAQALGVPVRAKQGDALAVAKSLGSRTFDVVYADPPYDYAHYDALLMALDGGEVLRDGGIVAFEHRRRTEPFSSTPRNLRLSRTAEYGEVWISFFIT
jgi:16S rRNA (guanine966-N2)-methyltransferase